MVDIQSATAEVRRGKKKRRRRWIEETIGENIRSASATQGGHKEEERKIETTGQAYRPNVRICYAGRP